MTFNTRVQGTHYIYSLGKSSVSYLEYKRRLLIFVFILSLLALSNQITGPHQRYLDNITQHLVWYGTWLVLGVVSSIGLGTGLHTFVLFLGPYIAEVTIAAYECHGAELLTRHPTNLRYQCANIPLQSFKITVLSIFNKVKWESFIWGVGTSLGELPPYFIARAVALSGQQNLELTEGNSFKENTFKLLHIVIQKLGFFGILLFASIPNPLFDLAGVTCGHFLMPFSTFFGATLLGKACIKATIQSLLVILAFSHDTLSLVLTFTDEHLPLFYKFIKQVLEEQSKAFKDSPVQTSTYHSNIALFWNAFLASTVIYFALSSIEALGIAYIKEKTQKSNVK
ncbi:hypothetical protein K501DRAFT_323390 [Backusella circina FSU 941]|nr:hypothetical protein K501DRAFT_323390 [Backusella circina FSU 941]